MRVYNKMWNIIWLDKQLAASVLAVIPQFTIHHWIKKTDPSKS